MKIDVQQAEQTFQPITLTLTIETPDEWDALYVLSMYDIWVARNLHGAVSSKNFFHASALEAILHAIYLQLEKFNDNK